MKVLRLTEYNFKRTNTENNIDWEARYSRDHGVFIDDKDCSALEKVKYYIENSIGIRKIYLGDDGQIYPQFEIVDELVR
ncbi:MAG: hypothetical protein ACFFFC_00740 [Candidatus Thorarchaeota archaeon]